MRLAAVSLQGPMPSLQHLWSGRSAVHLQRARCHISGPTLFLAIACMLIKHPSAQAIRRADAQRDRPALPDRRANAGRPARQAPSRAQLQVCERAHAALAPHAQDFGPGPLPGGCPDGRYPNAGQPGRRASARAEWPALTAELDCPVLCHMLMGSADVVACSALPGGTARTWHATKCVSQATIQHLVE